MYQVRKWPLNPLDLIVKSIAKRKDSPVVADFGCGEGKLAERLESRCQKIHSFDLVAKNDRVTVCDFSRYSVVRGSPHIRVRWRNVNYPDIKVTNMMDFWYDSFS